MIKKDTTERDASALAGCIGCAVVLGWLAVAGVVLWAIISIVSWLVTK